MNTDKINYGKIDLFAIPVSLFATRRKQYSGSCVGVLLTILFVCCILGFLSFKYTEMMLAREDKYSSQTMANDLQNGQNNHFKIMKENLHFLPSF